MTFQIFVGGVRVNSDLITSTSAWGGQQQGQQVSGTTKIE
jgi:hypothetical protein